MKIYALVNASDRMRKANAGLVRVLAYKEGKNKRGEPVAMARTYTPKELNVHRKIVDAKDKNRYVSSIAFKDRALNVRVSCSCPDYMYRFEWPNAQAGAGDIIYGNGEVPEVYLSRGLCKHLLALRAVLKSRRNI